MTTYKDEGVVIKTMRLGEADRIITLLTSEHGKVRAVAKGVRKTKSRFGARLEPTNNLALMCWQGRELDIVTQVEVLDHFKGIRRDLDRLEQAMVALEAVDQIAQERHPSAAMHRMLVGALRVLDERGSPLTITAFLLKLLVLDGSMPVLDSCASCGAKEHLVAFDILEGGLLCSDCRSGMPVSQGAVSLLRMVLGGRLAAALDEPASDITRELSRLATRTMESHIERRLRTVSGFKTQLG
jgi:DNA repair protein RecO (recombination protein O)